MSALRVRTLSATTTAAVLAAASMVYAQSPASSSSPSPAPVVRVASAAGGSIYGAVVDERGTPVEGAVVSALGGATAFAVTDSAGQYRLADLPAGPYVMRVHRDGFSSSRSTLVNVRPAQKAPSSFTLRRIDEAPAAVQTAGVALPEPGAAPRDESPLAWRLRRLTRSVLKDDTGAVGGDARAWNGAPSDQNFLARAFDVSARLAANVISDWPLTGQVNFLTATAYDDSGEMVAFGPATGAAFFSVGAPVGTAGDWSARASMNSSDVTSWTMAGDYRSRATAAHQMAFGVAYSLQAYRGGNVAALQAVPDGHRKVAAIYGSHEFAVAPGLTVGYGARYEHFDYLGGHGLVSPSLRTTFALTPTTRVYARASVRNIAPGAEEFVPPADAWVPPQRTFATLTGKRFDTEQVRHGEVGVTRSFGETALSLAAFVQTVDDQLVTVFGAADPGRLIAAGGHYAVASAGDAVMQGWRLGLERRFLPHVYGKASYSALAARWSAAPDADRRALAAAAPEALTPDSLVHDLDLTLDAEMPQTDTRLYVLYRVSTGFTDMPAVPMGNGRFDVQLRQGLPLSGRVGEWEMLVGVRSLFRSSLEDRSMFDELLVVRAPKRVVCGLQVRF